MQNLIDFIKSKRLSSSVAAGTTTINSASIDTQLADGVLFKVSFGAIVAGAATSIKLQQSADDGVVDAFADLEGTSIVVADTDDEKDFFIDVKRPLERYVRVVVLRATQNSEVDGIWAQSYGLPQHPPVGQDATVGAFERHVSPAEGVA